MAELKRFEYIIEFEPVGAVNGKGEVCFQAKGDRMTRLVRCRDCKHWVANGTEFASCDLDALVRSAGFFCACGEQKE